MFVIIDDAHLLSFQYFNKFLIKKIKRQAYSLRQIYYNFAKIKILELL